MLAWITANIGTIIVCLVLAAVVAAVIATMVRNRKKGKSSCGCGSSACSMAEFCHPAKK